MAPGADRGRGSSRTTRTAAHLLANALESSAHRPLRALAKASAAIWETHNGVLERIGPRGGDLVETLFAAESSLQDELNELDVEVLLKPTCASCMGATPLTKLKGEVRWIIQ